MAHKVEMGDDGILRMIFVGDVSEADKVVMKEADLLMEAASGTEPFAVLSDVIRAGKLSSAARKNLAAMGSDPRMGKNTIVGASRYQRVMAGFVIKASGRDGIRFFDSDEKALTWLKGES